MATAPSAALERRHAAVRAALTDQALDALVVTALPNVLYLTNFGGSAGILVVLPDALRFITDSRYVTSLAETRGLAHECPGLQLDVVQGSYDVTLAEVLASSGARRVGFEAADLTVARHAWLLATLDPARVLVPTTGVVERLRVRKDAYELDVFREAGRRLSAVVTDVFTIVRAGRREDEIAADIDWRMRNAGFERPAFDTIVASGPRAALPHARPSERTLGEGDVVVLDFGGVYASYCVDITRTVVVGRASERARSVHRAVLAAQQQAIAAVAPGMSRFAIDAAARVALEQAGMGEAFGHGTGHGLGLQIHEDPRVVQRRPGVDTRDEVIEAGMVFTVEPGAYFPGWGGVRIEDDVIVTDRGAERITTVTSELLEL
ncbi:MAG: M24 family metallopeptidase [Vicinamibacterales bacterium]